MNREWERFGEKICTTVQDAIENQDYEKLNQVITETLDQAVDTVSKGVKSVAGTARTEYHSYKTYSTKKLHRKRETTPQKEPVQTWLIRQPSKVGALVQTVFGFAFGGGWLLAALIEILVAIFGVSQNFGLWIMTRISLAIGAAGILLGVQGSKRLGKLQRFERYCQILDGKSYCEILKLAEKEGRPAGKIVKDLEFMIRNRWFVQGHLDQGKTCLMITDEVYEQYRQLEQRTPIGKEAVQQKTDSGKKLPAEIQKVVDLGDEYVRKIRKCNDEIPGEEISEKIERIEHLVDRIFDRVEQDPKCVSDIQKLMDYYLPTTVKLLEAYAQMDAQPAQGENIRTAKKEIEASLDTLNIAFEQLLDSLFQETAWDVSSDISVLNTMLAQEGLKKKDF